MDDDIGVRVRALRKARGLTLEVTAGLAGMSTAMLSYLERGERSLERRSHVDALAYALKVAPSELLGQPYTPVDPARSRAQAGIDEIRSALMGTELGHAPEVTPMPLPDLVDQARSTRTLLCRAGDTGAAATELPDVLAGLHYYAASGDERSRVTALGALVLACCTACSLAKELGYVELAWIGAERARQAAAQIDDPVLAAMAAYHVSQALQPYARCLASSLRAIDAMEPHAGASDLARQMYGMLHLMAAHSSVVVGQADDGRAHLAEAAELAARSGDRLDLEMCFGPTNLNIWRVLIAVESGDGGRAVEIAQGMNIESMPSVRRQAMYHVDLGRALA